MEERVQNLVEEINSLVDEKLEAEEKLDFTEKELKDVQNRISELRKNPHEGKVVESSRESDDVREYVERMDQIEAKVDKIKLEIGEIKVESFDKLKEEYELKYKGLVKELESELIQKSISEKGVINVLKELKGTMNDSIRVLK